MDYLPIEELNGVIPKKIHYCWFGSKEMGELELMCLDSWKTVLPDYQFSLWTENSLDLSRYPFAWRALQAGKYAFVSDVVRLYALKQEGGIYLDTDMLVLKDFTPLLNHDFFTGEYKKGALNAAIIGSKKGHPLLGKLLESYKDLDFDYLNPKTIPEVFDELVWTFPKQSVKIYSPEAFYPLPLENKEDNYIPFLSESSFAVHLWNHSWKDEFALMKENRFFDSLTLASKHFCSYPQAYRNWEYFNRFRNLYWRNLKRYLRLKLSE